MITQKVSVRFTNEELLILKDMAVKKGTNVSALCRQHILFGESSGIAIRDESIQERVDGIEIKLEALGQLVTEVNQKMTEGHDKLEEIIRKGVSALADRMQSK